MHDVLSNPLDRAILYLLQDEAAPVRVATLARRVTSAGGEPTLRGRGDEQSSTALWDVRGHVRAMTGLGILGYDARSDAAWIPDDVTISVAPPWAPTGPNARDEPTPRRRSTAHDTRSGPEGRARPIEDDRQGAPDGSPTSAGD